MHHSSNQKKRIWQTQGGDANTRKSKDDISATKNHEHHSGYRAYTLVNEIKIIEKLSLTPASVHDSKIDISIPGIICYRDNGILDLNAKVSMEPWIVQREDIHCQSKVYAGIFEYHGSDP